MSNPNTVELFGVTKRFGRQIAVDGLDLTVPEGSIYGFIGPNGSGKTTTLRLILRILQPDQGQVVVFGSANGSVADDRLGYLPEDRGLYKRMRVGQLLTYFAHLKGLIDCRQQIDRWLETLDASSWASKRVDSLSKGMAQKVQFIAAVIARPRFLILDEPFAGLDPVNLEILRSAVLELRNEGTTIIFSTHDMHVAERLCDTVLMIFRGKKVLDGTLDSIQQQYPANRLKIRLVENATLPTGLPGVVSCEQRDAYCRVQLDESVSPSELLSRLASRSSVEHFEVIRPTLHDIFVDIAKPDGALSES